MLVTPSDDDQNWLAPADFISTSKTFRHARNDRIADSVAADPQLLVDWAQG